MMDENSNLIEYLMKLISLVELAVLCEYIFSEVTLFVIH